MQDERNRFQIIRKDARGCFVESLSDAFSIGKAHFAFASYDVSKPAGQRQTNNVHIYVDAYEILELCRQLTGGELRYQLQQHRQKGEKTPLRQWLGGTSADKLRQFGKPRQDGKSLSRTAQLLCGSKSDFLFVADSGPGETDVKGLIVPKFGSRPENHVAVSLTYGSFSELMLLTKAHYEAWLSAWYVRQISEIPRQNQDIQDKGQFAPEPAPAAVQMF